MNEWERYWAQADQNRVAVRGYTVQPYTRARRGRRAPAPPPPPAPMPTFREMVRIFLHIK